MYIHNKKCEVEIDSDDLMYLSFPCCVTQKRNTRVFTRRSAMQSNAMVSDLETLLTKKGRHNFIYGTLG